MRDMSSGVGVVHLCPAPHVASTASCVVKFGGRCEEVNGFSCLKKDRGSGLRALFLSRVAQPGAAMQFLGAEAFVTAGGAYFLSLKVSIATRQCLCRVRMLECCLNVLLARVSTLYSENMTLFGRPDVSENTLLIWHL